MATTYYRWIKSSSADLTTALERQQLRSTYLKKGELKESKSALWLFQMGANCYIPRAGISSDRTLVKITYKAEGETIMEHPDNHIDFESSDFSGEAGHPLKIIVKSNEIGARGIGSKILEFLNARISRIEIASSKEIQKAT